MSKKDVDASPSITGGTSLICSNHANLLIDLGSTNFFVCPKFVCLLNVIPNTMTHITVSILIGDTVFSYQAYKSCVVNFEGHELSVDIIVLDIQVFLCHPECLIRL